MLNVKCNAFLLMNRMSTRGKTEKHNAACVVQGRTRPYKAHVRSKCTLNASSKCQGKQVSLESAKFHNLVSVPGAGQ